ncbi:MAG: hypothetical protein HY360_13950 [Verrucomicrobia bacterium]|nr:hypothetical protein [Verrucomicrobiota bacterium]
MKNFCIRVLVVVSALLMQAVCAKATDVYLDRGCDTKEWTETTSDGISTTTLTFSYGDLEVKVPRAAHWVENQMLHRPQLALWRCEPLSSPSTVHLELLGNNPRPKGEGLVFSLVDPSPIAQGYVSSEWIAISNAPPVTAAASSTGYRRVESTFAPEIKGYREEIHIFKMNEFGFRLRLLLSPKLKENDETAIREAISKLIVQATPAKK